MVEVISDAHVAVCVEGLSDDYLSDRHSTGPVAILLIGHGGHHLVLEPGTVRASPIFLGFAHYDDSDGDVMDAQS